MKNQSKQPGMRKKQILKGLALITTTVAINFFTHFEGVVRANVKAAEFPLFRRTAEVQILMNYQGQCLDECLSYWLVVPGSAIWRQHKFPEVGDPSKYYQLNKPYQEKRHPKRYNPSKIFKI